MEFSGRRSPSKLNRRRRLLSNSLSVWLVIATFLLCADRTVGQQTTEADSIRNLLNNQVEAWNRGDIDGYMQGYWASDRTVFTSGGTLTKGYREVLSRYKKAYDTRQKMGKLEFRDLVVEPLSPTVAVAMGIWRLVRASDEPWGRFTLILVKKPEGWRITHDHTSSAGK